MVAKTVLKLSGVERHYGQGDTRLSILKGADFELPLWEFGLPDDASIEVEDMVTGHHFTWHGKYQHIQLDPFYKPYAIWRLIPPGAPR